MKKMHVWAACSLQRIYRETLPPEKEWAPILHLGQNDRGSFQIVYHPEGFSPSLSFEVFAPEGLDITVREVGYVYLKEGNTDTPENEQDRPGSYPGPVPDPLFPIAGNCVSTFTRESGALWVTVRTKPDTQPGTYPVPFVLSYGTQKTELTCQVIVYPVLLREENALNCMHWLNVNCIMEWHGFTPFEESVWPLIEQYMRDMLEHGNNYLNSCLFTQPTNGVQGYSQLLKVKRLEQDGYQFDWTDVLRWIHLAKKLGFKGYVWPHLFTQWGAAHPAMIYENYDGCYEGRELWPASLKNIDPVYRNFLEQLLPQFHDILIKENIIENSYFHLSDEPPHTPECLENYRVSRAMVKEIAPWIRCMDGLNHADFAKNGMTDMPIAGIVSAVDFVEKKIPHWAYFCCGPRGSYLNRLMDTPLAKIRGSGWLYRYLHADGFAHWGYNYWYKMNTNELINPYTVTHGCDFPMIPHGDCFLVYPGQNGPVDSIRWEIFGESLKDYMLLSCITDQTMDHLLRVCFENYAKYPKHNEWYSKMRQMILEKVVK